MSWSEAFPVFTDDDADEYQRSASIEEKTCISSWYAVEKVFNRRAKNHILSLSLFWKPVRENGSEIGTPTRELMQKEQDHGPGRPRNAWEHYVAPILDEAEELASRYPDLVIRVYLANDLAFLIDDLTLVGCEVWWMSHSSLKFAPGGLWRFLALEDDNKLVTISDIDRISEVASDIERTVAMNNANLGAWRVPYPGDENEVGAISYRPIIANQLGAKSGLPVKLLLEAFSWHAERGSLISLADLPGCGPRPIAWTNWPYLYSDEWFLAVVLYPRIAVSGVLTFAPANARSQWLTLDIEYVTWANPDSQLVYFSTNSCCEGSVQIVPNHSKKSLSLGEYNRGITRISSLTSPDPLWIVADAIDDISVSQSDLTASLLGALLRNTECGEIISINNSESSYFERPDKRLREIRCLIDHSFDGSLCYERKRLDILAAIADSIPIESRQWVVLIHPSSIAIRGIDHLLPPQVNLNKNQFESDFLYVDDVDSYDTCMHITSSPRLSSRFISMGFWAVRGEYLQLVINLFRDNTMNLMSNTLFSKSWNQTIKNLPLKKSRIERGEISCPNISNVQWTSVANAALVTVPDWPKDQRISFINSIHLGFHPKNRGNMLTKIVENH